MSDTTTPAPAGSTPQGAGAQPSPTGGPTPSATPGLALSDVQAAIAAAVAPIAEQLKHFTNAQNAQRRVEGGNGAGAPPAASPDVTALQERLRAAEERDQQRDLELKALKTAENQRVERERRASLDRQIDDAIRAGEFANTDVLKDLVLARRPHLGTTGEAFVNDGDKLIKLADVVADLGKRDIFKKAAPGGGTGALPEAASGIRSGEKELTGEDIEKMSPADFAALRAQMMKDSFSNYVG